jgi:hypothetical protein
VEREGVKEKERKGKEKKRIERKVKQRERREKKMCMKGVALLFEMRAFSGRKGTFSVLLLFLLFILILLCI